MEEQSQSQSVRTCIVIGLSFLFYFRLRQSGFHLIVSDRVRSGIGRKWKLSDSSDSDSVAVATPLLWFRLRLRQIHTYIHTYIHNSTWIGLLLTTRDFPTFSVVVVIKVKKLFWLLSRGKKTSLKVVAILLPTVLSRTTITQIIVNCEVMGEMLLEPITFPTWNV